MAIFLIYFLWLALENIIPIVCFKMMDVFVSQRCGFSPSICDQSCACMYILFQVVPQTTQLLSIMIHDVRNTVQYSIARCVLSGQVARINTTRTTNFTGVLTTDYTRAPGPTGDCLTFDFYLRNDAELHVSIELSDGVRRKVWRFAGHTWGRIYGRVPIQVSKAYRVTSSYIHVLIRPSSKKF